MPLQTKKNVKVDPIKISLFRIVKIPTNSGYYLYGKTRSGKTVLMLRISCSLHDKYNFKVWDIWGGKRNQGENLYWLLPSPYKKYWNFVKKKFRFDAEGPKQYKVNLYYPITKSMPKELPLLKDEKDQAIVTSVPFSIPIRDVSIEMIKFCLNSLSDNDITLWESIRNNLKKDDGMAELTKIFEKKGINTHIYKNFFKPLIELRMLSSENDETSFDLIREAKDREGIFVLVLHYVPEKFRLLIMAWLIRKMWEAMNMSKISGRNLINIREATEFFRATEKSTIENRFKEFKIFLTEFIRQARGRMAFVLDAQSPTETSGLVSGSEDMTVLGKMPSEDDRKNATDQLKRDGKMTPKQITELGELNPGEYFFVESGKDAKKRYSFLPRCDFFRETDQNFYLLWKKRMGNHAFKNIKDKIKSLDNQYKIRISQMREEEKQKNSERQAKEKMKEKIEEEKKMNERLVREMVYERKKREEKQKLTRELREKGKNNKQEKPQKKKDDGVMEASNPHEVKESGSIPSHPNNEGDKHELELW